MRRDLVGQLQPHRLGPGEAHPWRDAEGTWEAPNSRWTAGRDVSWEPLALGLVCEVAYDHLQGDRFRHATSFVRWRPDRAPSSCTYDQLDVAVPFELAQVLGA
jgi:ATP-dependent DNA ligase